MLKSAPSTSFHDEEPHAPALAGIEGPHDARMVEGANRGYLPLESCHGGDVPGERAGEDFYRDAAFHLPMFRPMNRAKPAPADDAFKVELGKQFRQRRRPRVLLARARRRRSRGGRRRGRGRRRTGLFQPRAPARLAVESGPAIRRRKIPAQAWASNLRLTGGQGAMDHGTTISDVVRLGNPGLDTVYTVPGLLEA